MRLQFSRNPIQHGDIAEVSFTRIRLHIVDIFIPIRFNSG